MTAAAKVLEVLGSFDDGHRRLTLTRIAERTGLPLTTTHRVVAELVAWGALERRHDDAYVIGRRLWNTGLLAPVQTDLRVVAAPFVHDLHAATGATVHLAVLDGDRALYVDRTSGRRSVPIVSDVGTRLPLHATGVGKVLLAHAPAATVEAVLRDLPAMTTRTVTDVEVLAGAAGDGARAGVRLHRAGDDPRGVLPGRPAARPGRAGGGRAGAGRRPVRPPFPRAAEHGDRAARHRGGHRARTEPRRRPGDLIPGGGPRPSARRKPGWRAVRRPCLPPPGSHRSDRKETEPVPPTATPGRTESTGSTDAATAARERLASSDTAQSTQERISAEITAEHDADRDARRAGAHVPATRLDFAPYRSSVLRHPTKDRVLVDPEDVELWAPAFGERDVDAVESDLTLGGVGEPVGERMVVTGRVVDGQGRPVRHQLVEVWQANAAGRYAHHRDQHPAPLDPNFTGVGRCLTDQDGWYRFTTVKPGPYPWKNHRNAWRPAHIHFSLFGHEFTQRLVTQMYFPGDPLFDLDPIYQSPPPTGPGNVGTTIWVL